MLLSCCSTLSVFCSSEEGLGRDGAGAMSKKGFPLMSFTNDAGSGGRGTEGGDTEGRVLLGDGGLELNEESMPSWSGVVEESSLSLAGETSCSEEEGGD